MTTEAEIDLGKVFAALTHDDRRAILHLLRRAHENGQPGLSITQIAVGAEISRFGASHHLGVLRVAGLIRTVPENRAQISSIVPHAVVEAIDWLIPFTDGTI